MTNASLYESLHFCIQPEQELQAMICMLVSQTIMLGLHGELIKRGHYAQVFKAVFYNVLNAGSFKILFLQPHDLSSLLFACLISIFDFEPAFLFSNATRLIQVHQSISNQRFTIISIFLTKKYHGELG